MDQIASPKTDRVPNPTGVTKADMNQNAAPSVKGMSTVTAGKPDIVPDPAMERLGTPTIQQTQQDQSIISAAAVYLYRQARFNPISNLNPESLTYQLTEWSVGTMRRFALTMDAVENRDGLIKTVSGKLKQSLSRNTFEIVPVDGADPDEVDAQTKVLKDFYSNVKCTNSVDRNIRGGFSTLVHQMMDAALKRYAVHEIIWRPNADGTLSATFSFVPLWFFENRTGSLRFCGNFAWDGIPLKEGNWMVTCGDGLMEAAVVAYIYKVTAVRDWMIYNERCGMPGVVGKTTFGKGSDGWNAIRDAVAAVSTDFSAVIGATDDIDKVEFGTTGQLPYPPLVEYMDKIISALFRGADLSTLSAGGSSQQSGQGASLQADETDLIEQYYAQVISETFNNYVDLYVLRWHFGDDVKPAAYCKLNLPKPIDTKSEMEVDTALTGMGIHQSKTALCERYGRTEATPEQIAEGDVVTQATPLTQQGDLLTAPKSMSVGLMGKGTPEAPSGTLNGTARPANHLPPGRTEHLQQFRDNHAEMIPQHVETGNRLKAFRDSQPARARLAMFHQAKRNFADHAKLLSAQATNELKPLVNRVQTIVEMSNDEHYFAAVKALRHDLADLVAKGARKKENAPLILTVNEIIHHPAFDN